VDLALAHGEDLGGNELVHHMALESADGLGLVDDDDIFVCIDSRSAEQSSFCDCTSRGVESWRNNIPSLSWIMPKMPAMLETRVALLEACGLASLKRRSPVGRSITNAGASGDDGEVKV
jgi:hypothetical protein